MKIALLIVTIILGGFSAKAQVLFSENFNNMAVGAVGNQACHPGDNCENMNPSSACYGQNNWLYGSTCCSGINSYVQILQENDIHENVLKVSTNPNNWIGGLNIIWRDDLDVIWAGRIGGNDIIEVEFDLFLESPLGVTNYFRSGIWDDCGNSVTTFSINLSNNSYSTYTTLAENTWHRIGYSYDVSTGLKTYKGPGYYVTSNSTTASNEIITFVIGIFESHTFELPSIEAKIDNITIRATNVENLLSIDETEMGSNAIKMYPNPVNDLLKISTSTATLTKIEVMDVNGRLLKSMSLNNILEAEINVSDLNSGIYMVNIYSENTKTTKKFVKN